MMATNDDDRTGTPMYRCTLCGGVTFKTDSKIGPDDLLTFINNGPQVVEVRGVPRSIVHLCPNGGAGIAHIVGVVPDEVLHASIASFMGEHGDEDEEVDEGKLN